MRQHLYELLHVEYDTERPLDIDEISLTLGGRASWTPGSTITSFEALPTELGSIDPDGARSGSVLMQVYAHRSHPLFKPRPKLTYYETVPTEDTALGTLQNSGPNPYSPMKTVLDRVSNDPKALARINHVNNTYRNSVFALGLTAAIATGLAIAAHLRR